MNKLRFINGLKQKNWDQQQQQQQKQIREKTLFQLLQTETLAPNKAQHRVVDRTFNLRLKRSLASATLTHLKGTQGARSQPTASLKPSSLMMLMANRNGDDHMHHLDDMVVRLSHLDSSSSGAGGGGATENNNVDDKEQQPKVLDKRMTFDQHQQVQAQQQQQNSDAINKSSADQQTNTLEKQKQTPPIHVGPPMNAGHLHKEHKQQLTLEQTTDKSDALKQAISMGDFTNFNQAYAKIRLGLTNAGLPQSSAFVTATTAAPTATSSGQVPNNFQQQTLAEAYNQVNGAQAIWLHPDRQAWLDQSHKRQTTLSAGGESSIQTEHNGYEPVQHDHDSISNILMEQSPIISDVSGVGGGWPHYSPHHNHQTRIAINNMVMPANQHGRLAQLANELANRMAWKRARISNHLRRMTTPWQYYAPY